MITPDIRKECGAARAEVKHLIYFELRKRGLPPKEIAKQLKCSSKAVYKVITGGTHSTRILDRLKKAGVPPCYLHDPRDYQVREAI